MIPSTFTEAFSFVLSYGYFIIFLIMVVEGPFITTAAAFAASLGHFNIWVIFFLSLIADIVGDFIHYGIGYGARRAILRKYRGQMNQKKGGVLYHFESHLHNHFGKTFTFIKFAPPFTTPGLLLTGAFGVPFKKFLFYSFVITLPRTVFFTVLGFYFGIAVDSVLKYFQLGQYLFLGFVVVIVATYFLFKYFERSVARKI